MSSISTRPFKRLLPLLLSLGGIVTLLSSAQAQRPSKADAYYLDFSLNALRQPFFCHKLDSAIGVPRCYGVDYDSLGRPTQITRFIFGNIDSYSEWAIMKFRYETLPRGAHLVRRTWHNPSGFPIPLGIAYGEEAVYDSTGAFFTVTAIDNEGKRVEKVNAVTRMIFQRRPDGSYQQEWRYSNNKQYFGSEEDIWGTQFAPLVRNAWFRIFRTDKEGHLIEELPWGLDKKPTPFPGGELVRRYGRNSCGLPTSVRFFDPEDRPMEDSSGVAGVDYEYDHKGRLVSWRSFNLVGKPKGRKEVQGAARMTREYRDVDGALIRETLFDAEGNEIRLSDEKRTGDSWEG